MLPTCTSFHIPIELTLGHEGRDWFSSFNYSFSPTQNMIWMYDWLHFGYWRHSFVIKMFFVDWEFFGVWLHLSMELGFQQLILFTEPASWQWSGLSSWKFEDTFVDIWHIQDMALKFPRKFSGKHPWAKSHLRTDVLCP